MDTLTDKFVELRASYSRAKGCNRRLVDRALAAHLRTQSAKRTLTQRNKSCWAFVCRYVVFPLLMAVIFTPMFVPELRYAVQDYFMDSPCLVENNMFFSEISRPLFDCNVCKDIHEAPILKDVTKEEFLQKYAYSSIPILIKGATRNWTAMHTFSFSYFKDLYERARKQTEEAHRDDDKQHEHHDDANECQFFPYKTEFGSLEEALYMPNERAVYEPGQKPWYFGWSNCNPYASDELRKHYERPYFLPDDSETSSIDWIFMGGDGPGAFMHLDSVLRPSWQAQITGSKTWILQPGPECEHICRPFNITMETGDIIVVDTNVWFHATHIHPGQLSITIGSEYD